MTRMRSLTARSLAVLGPVLALTVWLGGGPVVAASHVSGHAAGAAAARVARAGVAFRPLTLVNGWASAQSQWGTGNPGVGFSNGVVYLSGSLYQASGTDNIFATLPGAYWPGHDLSFPVYTYGGTEGTLVIHPDGRMVLSGGSVTSYSSLAGVSFPLTLTTRRLTLLNGWKSAGAVIGDPGASNNGGVVYLSGGLDQPSGTNGTFAMLPRASRPGHRLYLPIYTTDGQTGMEGSLYISPQGEMSLFGNTATRNFSSLAGVSFPLTLTTRKLTLLNGWKSAQPVYQTGDPGVAISRGVVYLSGSAWLPSGSQTILARLPAAYRPSHWLYLPVYTLNGTEGSLVIDPHGNVSVYNSASAYGFTSLAGIHYPLGS